MTNLIVGGITDIKGGIKMGKKKKNQEGHNILIDTILIDEILTQLENSGNFEKVKKGWFDDDSGSWIDCYHKTSPNSDGKRYCNHLSFNGEGTVLEDVQVWVEQMSWDDDKCKQLR